MKLIMVLLLILISGTIVSAQGVKVFRSNKDNTRSAIEIWPTRGEAVNIDAKAELVIYQKSYNQGCYQRFNISAMNDNEPMFRFGVERGNCPDDIHLPIVFCFERPEAERGLPAKCPFILDSDGESVHIIGKLYVNGVQVGVNP